MPGHRISRTAVVCATLAVAGLASAGTSAADTAERRADVALTASPQSVSFPAGGTATVRLDYSNPGNVPKPGATISAEIPDGLTVEAAPAPGWACHVDDFPALVCNSEDTLNPGDSVVPAEVTLRAERAVDTSIEFGTLGFYRDPTENPADNYSTVTVAVTG